MGARPDRTLGRVPVKEIRLSVPTQTGGQVFLRDVGEADDLRGQREHQIGILVGGGFISEQAAEPRDVAKPGRLRHALGRVSADEAGEQARFATLEPNHRGDGTGADGDSFRVSPTLTVSPTLEIVDLEIEGDLVVVVDPRARPRSGCPRHLY